jgi:hypothetical protein
VPTRRQQDIETLRRVIASFPEGASLAQIEAAADLAISRRTLIRRLAELVAAKEIRKSGTHRAARYTLPSIAPELAPTPKPTPSQSDFFVPLSKPGAEVLRLVTRPLSARKPVGYNREFLESYRPNRSSYLSAAERERLAELGKTLMPQQPAGTYAQQILNRLLIDLSWNSSRLEGNTYSLLDTQRLIELGESAEGKATTDTQMILNHKAAIEFLVQSAEEIGFNRHTILNLHALLADNLLADPYAAGRLRRIGVGITQSVYQPLAVPQLIEQCFDRLLATAAAIRDPFEQAFFVMVQLPYLQPFDDVNKRVSRLAANIPLIQENLAPLAFVDVPDETYTRGMLGVYELNRIELLRDVFLWAYERSAARYAAVRQSLGEPDPFRLRHRAALRELVAHVIRGKMDQKTAAAHIAIWATNHVQESERGRFIDAAETELLALHDGNFARYQIRPTEFEAWRKAWNRKPQPAEKDDLSA